MKKTLMIDMDQVLVDFLQPLINTYNFLYDKEVKKLDFLQWDLMPYIGKKGINIFYQKGFFINLEPLPFAQHYVEKLFNDGHKIIIATNPPTKHAALEKYQFIEKYFPFIPFQNITMTAYKHLIKADLIIDDCPEYLELFDGVKICMDMPYNKKVKCDLRTDNWKQIYEYISKKG